MIINWKSNELEAEGTFAKGYPMPVCSDPSSPSYSDPGEAPSFEIDKLWWLKDNGEKVDVYDLLMAEFDGELEELCVDWMIAEAESDDRERGED